MGIYKIAGGIRTRREYFGGMVFSTRTGTTIELDREAFRLLEILGCGKSETEAEIIFRQENPQTLIKRTQIQKMLDFYRRMELLDEIQPSESVSLGRAQILEDVSWQSNARSCLSAPETVHWAITYRCENNCLDCYAEEYRQVEFTEMSTRQAYRLIDRLADWGVFQIAVGGGEPLLRQDLPLLASYIKQSGMVVHVTTSTRGLSPRLLEKLANSVTCLQVGIQPASVGDDMKKYSVLCKSAKNLGLHVGANLMANNSVIQNFDNFIENIALAGFENVTFLRYKPPASQQQWLKESPTPEILSNFAHQIEKVQKAHSHLRVRLDCALSFLQRHVFSCIALKAGLRGCVAGDRILAVAPDGTVYPCSQLVKPKFRGGNLLKDDYRKFWADSPALQKLRYFRTDDYFQSTLCGQCESVEQCGGCRIFADDVLGADPGCPEILQMQKL